MPSMLEQYEQKMKLEMGKVAVRFVTLYEVALCYGGPEEGGWWYDNAQPVETREFATEELANEFAVWLGHEIEEHGLNNEPLSSCRGFDKLGTGRDDDDSGDEAIPLGFGGDARNYAVYVEEHAGQNRTTNRPHYE